MRKLLTEQLVAKGIAAPELPDPPPFTPTRRSSWTSPDRLRRHRWIPPFPAEFARMGFPLTDNGASTVIPGLYFCGVHFLRERKSSVLFGVARMPGHRGPIPRRTTHATRVALIRRSWQLPDISVRQTDRKRANRGVKTA